MVEVTGGEPLLQDAVYPLIDRLLANGRQVLIETNGSLSVAAIPVTATIIIDIKCPGSGAINFYHENLAIIRKRSKLRWNATEIKFVLTSYDDYLFARNMIWDQQLHEVASILFSPVQPNFPAHELAELMLRDTLPVRLQLQLHTLIWPESKRGV